MHYYNYLYKSRFEKRSRHDRRRQPPSLARLAASMVGVVIVSLSLLQSQILMIPDQQRQQQQQQQSLPFVVSLPVALAFTVPSPMTVKRGTILSSRTKNHPAVSKFAPSNTLTTRRTLSSTITTTTTTTLQSSVVNNDSTNSQLDDDGMVQNIDSGVPAGDASDDDKSPSFKLLLQFVSTTILIGLSEPLLSLVDTTVVAATTKGVVQLAALGPATLLCNSAMYFTFFLGIATTNRVAKALAHLKNNKRRNDNSNGSSSSTGSTNVVSEDNNAHLELIRAASHGLGVAAALGTILATIMLFFGRPLCLWSAGESATPELIDGALRYVQIRSIVAPLAVMGMVAQSICLACLDTRTPALAVGLASAVNIVGDIVALVGCQMGIVGAALATAAASVASNILLIREAKRKVQGWRKDYLKSSIKVEVPQEQLLVEAPQEQRVEVPQEQQVEVNGFGLEKVNGYHKKEEVLVATNDAPVAPATSHKRVSMMALMAKKSDLAMQVERIMARAKLRQEKKRAAAIMRRKAREQKKNAIPPFCSLPDRSSLLSLIKLAGPICFVIVGKIICYSSMTLRVTDFGLLPLASHNVLMPIFFFLTPIGDSLSQAAQSLLPQTTGSTTTTSSSSDREDENGFTPTTTSSLQQQQQQQQLQQDNKSKKAKLQSELIKKLGIMCVAIGLFQSNVAFNLCRRFGTIFSKDATILSLMRSNSLWMSSSLLIHPFVMLAEGIVIAKQDLNFLVLSYGITMATLMGLLQLGATSLGGVWRSLFLFQLIRLVQISSRVYKRHFNNNKAAPTKHKKKNNSLFQQEEVGVVGLQQQSTTLAITPPITTLPDTVGEFE